MRRCLLLLAAAAAAAACAGAVDLGETAWQATLSSGPGGIAAQVAAVSGSGRTHLSIAIQRAAAGQQYGWRIQQGDCQAEGAIVGAAAIYPALTAAADGTAAADVFTSQTLGAGPYAARVVQLQAGGETLAACGAMQRSP